MSQAKVDRYKSEKASRKKTLRKEKVKRSVTAVCGTVVCIVIVGWIGYSAYGYFLTQDDKSATVQTEVDMDALSDYMSTLPTSGETAE